MDNGNAKGHKTFRELKKSLKTNPAYQRQLLSLSNSKEGKEELNAFTTLVEIDEELLSTIEKQMPFLIGAIAEERQFVRTDGDVVPIERVRSISKDSIVDLSKHSNYLSHDPANTGGKVIPDKLFVAKKENDYAVYENRFLYTLLTYLSDFLELRLQQIMEISGRYEAESVYQKHIKFGQDTLDFSMTLKEIRNNDPLAQSHGESAGAVSRLSDSLTAVRMLLSTPLMKEVSNSPKVKAPITKTNIIRFDTNFRESLALFDYITSYDKPGFTTKEDRIHLTPFLHTKAEEDYASLLYLDSYVTYVYATGMDRELAKQEEEETKQEKELERAKLERDLEKAKKHYSNLEEAEQYILQLREKHQMDKEALEKASSEIATLRLARDERIHEMSLRFDSDMESFSQECQKQVDEANRLKQEALDQIDERIRLINEENEAKLAEKEKEKDELRGEIANKENEKDELNKTIEGKDAEIFALNSKIESLRASLHLPPENDLTLEENFDELEKRKKEFDRYYEEQWKQVKKAIRKRAFSAPDPKAKERRKK